MESLFNLFFVFVTFLLYNEKQNQTMINKMKYTVCKKTTIKQAARFTFLSLAINAEIQLQLKSL